MSGEKAAAQTKPESLEAKFKLLQLLPYDARAKRKHCLVYGFILDWYHSKYGDALASVRHIVSITKERDPAGKGLYAGDIHKALTDLVSWGYLDQEKGVGRKASRYVPIWEKLSSVHKIPNTTEIEISVRENTNTCVRENTNTTGDSVRSFTNQDPSTSTRVPDPETRVDIDMHCALPLAGLAPAQAAAMEEGGAAFHNLYLTYGVKKSLAEAEAEFAKRSWDMEELLAAATAWRKAWEAQNNPAAPRKRLHVWLRDRHYMEDPPSAYVKKERASKPANSNKELTAGRGRVGKRTVDIVGSDVLGDAGEETLFLDFCEQDVPFVWQHEIELTTSAGKDELAALCKARGLVSIENSTELHGHVQIQTTARGPFFYYPAPIKEAA